LLCSSTLLFGILFSMKQQTGMILEPNRLHLDYKYLVMCGIVSYDQLQDELLPWSGVDMDQNCGNQQKKLEHAGVFYMQNVNAANLKTCTQKV